VKKAAHDSQRLRDDNTGRSPTVGSCPLPARTHPRAGTGGSRYRKPRPAGRPVLLYAQYIIAGAGRDERAVNIRAVRADRQTHTTELLPQAMADGRHLRGIYWRSRNSGAGATASRSKGKAVHAGGRQEHHAGRVGPVRSVRGPLLTLHHANGKNAIIMSIVPRAEAVGGGEPYVYLIGPDGTHRSRLQTFGAGVSTQRYGGLAVMNKQGEEAVELFGAGLLPMRGPGLQVYGPSRDKAKRWLRSGTVFIGLTNDDEPHLTLTDQHGYRRAVLGHTVIENATTGVKEVRPPSSLSDRRRAWSQGSGRPPGRRVARPDSGGARRQCLAPWRCGLLGCSLDRPLGPGQA
jgi:hypothetical protein